MFCVSTRRWSGLLALPWVVQSAGVAFLAVGDWGGGSDHHPTTSAQTDTAKGMSKIATELSVEGILLLGDNFYSHGVSSEKSKRFKETFEDVYLEQDFKGLPFHVIAGNHDYRGNIHAQVNYHDSANRWRFPSLWYSLNFTLHATSGKERTLQLLMIDTVNLAGNSDDVCLGCALLGPANRTSAEEQWNWIESHLAASSADFLWVAGHYPIYSAGNDGTNRHLVERLLPMLKRHGAHYIDGHDHMLEHISYDGVEMFVTGMGKECCYGTGHLDTVPQGAIKFMISGDGGQGQGVGPRPSSRVSGGFASLEFDDVATVKYYDQSGEVLYTAPGVPPRSSREAELVL